MACMTLGPFALMENLDRRVLGQLFAKAMRTRLGQSQKEIQLIAADDIGDATVEPFLHLETWGYGKDIGALSKTSLESS